MIDPGNVPEVGADETLARYVLFSSHVRNDQSLKPDAFMPPRDRQLSVTRHLLATDAELWKMGDAVAAVRRLTLYGRGDVGVAVCLALKLSVAAAPIAGNPNHAHVFDWPADKAAQKIIAQEIAATAVYVGKK